MSSQSLLKLDRLTRMFGQIPAVFGVSLDLVPGERHAVLGPNGAGKTTLFNLVTGFLRPSSGSVHLFGKDVSNVPVHRRAAMGLARTFQVTNLFMSLTVFHNVLLAWQAQEPFRLAFHRPLSRYPGLIDRVETILDQWGIAEKRDVVVSNLSYGEQRQLEVIMALANRPRLLLLDEPTAGLSPLETASMTHFLNQLDSSITILLIEHDMDVVFELAQNITVMHFGQVIAQGPVDRIKGDPRVMAVYLGEGPAEHADH